MEPIHKLLLVGALLYVTSELVWWYAMLPPTKELGDALSSGFPTDGAQLEYVKELVEQLRKILDKGEHVGYVWYAFGGTYVRKQFFSFSSGVFYLNILAGALFGVILGLILTTTLATIGCVLCVYSARYSTTLFFWLCGVDIETILPLSPASRFVSQSLTRRSSIPSVTSSQGFVRTNSDSLSSRRIGSALLNNVIEKMKAIQVGTEERVAQLQLVQQQHHQTYSLICLLLRLIPVLPSWLINNFVALFELNIGQFALSVALGTVPYNLYGVLLGNRLHDMSEPSDLWDWSRSMLTAFLMALTILAGYTKWLFRDNSTNLVRGGH